MFEFSDITLRDKVLFDRYLRGYNPRISEMTFTNLFMWRNAYNLRYSEIGGFLCIVSVPKEGEPFAFFPLGAGEENFLSILMRMKELFFKNGWKLIFKRVSEEQLQFFKGIVDFERDIFLDRDNSDYLYKAEDLIHLKGKKYDGKRNHINRFKKEYSFEYVELDTKLIDYCQEIMLDWCLHRGCDHHKALYCEKLANSELLNNYEKLRCKGALIKVEGKYAAFTIGEMLNRDTAVIHIEKANDKIQGLYTFINQKFCENVWNDAVYINREQDLGMEGLRRAKLSYHPVEIIHKYTVIVG
ncbi:MAG: phosphatidylglycerol lysyltransferase domain-containing protein [Clostridia bacterium]|nr:phosphatidylglycerol lysyltransferase domain-containing protein [Clostridia bacterium]